jgi:hypothetical protein
MKGTRVNVAEAKKKSDEVCQCTCYKNGEITRTWQIDPNAPARGYPAEDNSSYESSSSKSYSSASAPAYEVSEGSTYGGSSAVPSNSYKKTKYSGASSYGFPTDSASKSSKKKRAKEEKRADDTADRGSGKKSSGGVSGKGLHVGDSEQDVRHSFGEPYISTTTASGESLWIYTQRKTVHGNSCDLVKWKLTFKAGRLKEWAEPKDEIYVGYCGGQ